MVCFLDLKESLEMIVKLFYNITHQQEAIMIRLPGRRIR